MKKKILVLILTLIVSAVALAQSQTYHFFKWVDQYGNVKEEEEKFDQKIMITFSGSTLLYSCWQPEQNRWIGPLYLEYYNTDYFGNVTYSWQGPLSGCIITLSPDGETLCIGFPGCPGGDCPMFYRRD